MAYQIEIFKSEEDIEINIAIENEMVWATQKQMAQIFATTPQNITLHLKHAYKEGEIEISSTCKEYLQVQIEGNRSVKRKQLLYNLDAILSVGYRVNSKRGTQFRQWATQRLKDYLVQGFAINEKRLAQKNQEVEYLKTGLRILNRALNEQLDKEEFEMLRVFAKGLTLLDDYDHEQLDDKGLTKTKTLYPKYEDYMKLIQTMYSEFESGVFAKLKDDGFYSSIGQIAQSFGEEELYPSLEEKAANLLYFITKNHSFVDGNKRIAAACFLYFLDKNDALVSKNGEPIIDNASLASLTLFIANSRTEEAEVVKKLVISVLNRNK